MRIGFIGDIVGRPGRKIVKEYLLNLRDEYKIDFVIANGENVSHGFGMTIKNCDELLKCGIDLITGGNHSFDKKSDMLVLLATKPVLRPDNYPTGVPGSGVYSCQLPDESCPLSASKKELETKKSEKLAVINLMGLYGMPQVENPFNHAVKVVEKLHSEGIKNILIDFHGEATSEKRVMMMMFKGKVSAICGTHTHISTDDLEVVEGTCYITDVGLTGCRDNVIGMDAHVPIQKATTGIGGHFDVSNNCKSIMQMIVMDIEEGKATDAFKIKLFDDRSDKIITNAIKEIL